MLSCKSTLCDAYISSRAEHHMSCGFNILWIIIPRGDTLSMICFIEISLVPSEDCTSFADLRRKLVKPVKGLGLEDTLLESLLSAEGILVLGFRIVAEVFLCLLCELSGLHLYY